MMSKLLSSTGRKPKRRKTLRDLDRVRHFEALFMQSFTEMRARSHKG